MMENEYAKIPVICKHNTCVFEVKECRSKVYWDWLIENRQLCPKVCPKYPKLK